MFEKLKIKIQTEFRRSSTRNHRLKKRSLDGILRQKCSTYIQYACAFFLACRQHLIFLRSENPIGYKKTDRVFYAIRFALFRYFLMKGRLSQKLLLKATAAAVAFVFQISQCKSDHSYLRLWKSEVPIAPILLRTFFMLKKIDISLRKNYHYIIMKKT